jgi:hypothetical protein
MRWLAALAQIEVPTEKLKSIRADIGSMLQRIRRKVRVDARQTCRLLGRIQSLSEAVLPQRLYARPILRALRQSLRRCKNYSIPKLQKFPIHPAQFPPFCFSTTPFPLV